MNVFVTRILYEHLENLLKKLDCRRVSVSEPLGDKNLI